MGLLLDASQHDWLQGRDPRITLVTCIVDATSQARTPASTPPRAHPLPRRAAPRCLHVPRPVRFLLERLHIVCMRAHSPQVNGRIERLWRTFQGRLVLERRPAGASTIEQATVVLDRFLPAYNARFTARDADAKGSFVRSCAAGRLGAIRIGGVGGGRHGYPVAKDF